MAPKKVEVAEVEVVELKCRAEGCERPVVAKGCCASHYRRLLRNPKAPLTPLAEKRGELVDVFSRVPAPAAAALERLAKRRGTTVYRLAAQLLEAAPDLLAAAEQTVRIFGPADRHTGEAWKALRRAEEGIAKAGGAP